MSTTTTGIGELGLVILPTADVDGAIEFYVDKMGFEKRTDVPFGDKYRWVEVYPPRGTAGIALAPPRPGTEDDLVPRDTGISLNCDDIDATHETLRGNGVDVDAEVSRMGGPVPPMFWLRDGEGNTLLVVETQR